MYKVSAIQRKGLGFYLFYDTLNKVMQEIVHIIRIKDFSFTHFVVLYKWIAGNCGGYFMIIIIRVVYLRKS